jgi:hypothetical protein
MMMGCFNGLMLASKFMLAVMQQFAPESARSPLSALAAFKMNVRPYVPMSAITL